MSASVPSLPSDAATRARLLEAAAERFADRGVDAVSIREICTAAGANVAAVNYYFRDKAGLHRAVIERAIALMQETTELSQRAGERADPEERLRAFVRVLVTRLTGTGHHAWVHRLMARELERPTEALELVMTRVMEPRMVYLTSVVAELTGLPGTDARVVRSALSVQTQCVAMARHRQAIASRWPSGDLEEAIDHIATFSIGGIRAIATATRVHPRRRRPRS